MSKPEWFFLGAIVGFILFALFIALVVHPIDLGYRKGQIDALTGKVKYHLVTLPDSTREWKEIKP